MWLLQPLLSRDIAGIEELLSLLDIIRDVYSLAEYPIATRAPDALLSVRSKPYLMTHIYKRVRINAFRFRCCNQETRGYPKLSTSVFRVRFYATWKERVEVP